MSLIRNKATLLVQKFSMNIPNGTVELELNNKLTFIQY